MAAYPTHAARAAGCSPVLVVCDPQTAGLHAYLEPNTVCVTARDSLWLEAALAAVPASVTAILLVDGAMPLLSSATMAHLMQSRQAAAVALLAGFGAESPHADAEGANRGGAPHSLTARHDTTTADPLKDSESTGIAVFARSWLQEHCRAVPPLHADSHQPTDVIAALAACARSAGAPVLSVRHVGATEELLQVADRADLAQAEGVLRARSRARAMRGGVTLVDPAAVWIDDTVTFGRDVTILPNCHLYGASAVGDNCVIGPNTRLQDSRLAANVVVADSVLEGAEADEHVRIGPFAHLRPGTVVGAGVEVGNFAELKNTRVGPGARIHHVGYLGDAVIGADVNVGAGAITCNYDGNDKHATEIGAGAFIGSGTLLVAPVHVGGNAMTGAGSVVTRDVPPSAKAYGVPARVRGVRAHSGEAGRESPGEQRGA